MIKIVALASWIIQKFQVRIKWPYSKNKKSSVSGAFFYYHGMPLMQRSGLVSHISLPIS